ncbi:MAG: leucyl aminopeptidase [Syntrophales bacterium]|nr:leucyl aminopeptidase [Syntrophales bacterium]
MKVLVEKANLAEFISEASVVFHFDEGKKLEGAAELLDKSSGGLITDVIAGGDFEGKLFQISVIYTRGLIPARRIIVAGLGKRADFNLEKLRGVLAKAASQVRGLNLKGFAMSMCLGDLKALNQPLDNLTEAAVEGVFLGLYQFTSFKTVERDKIKELKEFIIVEDREDAFQAIKSAAETAEIISRAVYFTRDLVSTPGNEMTPTVMVHKAEEIVLTGKNVRIEALDVPKMKELGMNALLAVARGSEEPARFIILEYRGGKDADPVVALVGKGLTFDSGGISIKPSEKMEEMKSDMAGGAAVMGAIMAVSELNLPVNVVGLIPATENLPGGNAYKPGDILRSMSGKTIEVLSTDAEGRLILADALTYAGKYNPAAVIDIATLTGACVVALGDHVIGMMGTDDLLKGKIRAAADATGERVWEMPLWDDYHETIKSDVADYKNSGGRAGGAITAAAFLSKFVGEYPWVHLDIAGPGWLGKDRPYIPKGASGVGVRLFVRFLRDWHAANS